MWTIDTLKQMVCNWEVLGNNRIADFLARMNRCFPPDTFHTHLAQRRRAIENAVASKNLLTGAVQKFPKTVNYQSLSGCEFDCMQGCAVVFTAGGEGERLRISLLDKGVPAESLYNFTKATYPLKNFHSDFGALQINLAMVSQICRKYKLDIPVIITTGPKTSITYRVIPKILEKYKIFGLPSIRIITQDERLHFTVDEKIAIQYIGGNPRPVTHPDETGGPLMKLKQSGDDIDKSSTLDWLADLNCEKILIMQGTAIYDPHILSYMSTAAKHHDCVGIGIPRNNFGPQDPFGTFVEITKESKRTVCIIEQDIRNNETRNVIDKNTGMYLPFNTGLYAVNRKLLEDYELPDYATSPKEILPELPKSPKIGYAATDLLPLSRHPLILTVNSDMYAVIKTADDLETMSETAVRFGLREIVQEMAEFGTDI